MQATRIDKRFHSNKTRITAVTVVLLMILGIGSTLAVITRDDAATSGTNVPAFVEPKTSAQPDVAANRPMTYQEFRFLENNMLPEAAPAPIVAFERWRFLEANELPVGDAPLVVPPIDKRGVPH